MFLLRIKMTIQQKYTFISRRCLLLVFCLFANISLALASVVVSPADTTICDTGGDAKFSVPANYTTYRWHKKVGSHWEIIPGQEAIGPSYTTGVAGEYRCVVTKGGISETSESARLTVLKAPIITGIIAPPVCDSTNLTARVDQVITNGSNLSSYVWKLGGATVDTAGITTNQVPDLVTLVKAKQYGSVLTLSVTNACGTTTSNNLPIVVNSKPPLPTPVTKDYCQDEKNPVALSISQSSNQAAWYLTSTGGSEIPAPTPNTSTPGTYT